MSIFPVWAINWQEMTGWFALLNFVLVSLTLLSILTIKKNSASAVAWCMSVFLMPIGGTALYWLFGYQSVYRPLERKRKHAESYRRRKSGANELAPIGPERTGSGAELAALSARLGASPMVEGNNVELYTEGQATFDAMLTAIRHAKSHIHLEFFIFRMDGIGGQFIEALIERARAGVQVRFLYDAIGSWSLHRSSLRPLLEAGGQVVPFLSINPLRRRIQINLRNHRKILVVDGKIAFTGGFNIGDEYIGKNAFFGPWRDTFLRLTGPAVRYVQRVFTEDWSFASQEELTDASYFPNAVSQGNVAAQIAWSGPDQDFKSIREIYFAAIVKAVQRVWIATPYFVPDESLFDALCLAARSGRDVRLLCPFRPDKWVPYLAARYYWADALTAGVKIYQYTPGFMHSKVLLIDDNWSSVGSANFDNRSLHLNFEMTCMMESSEIVSHLEAAFLHDLESSIRIDATQFGRRGFVSELAENGCRLLSPVL